ncbi:MAG: hypothetical protein ACFFEW_13240, partial [Candidatus Thorarchaeota archaeon]
MTLSDLIILLRQDLTQSFRISRVKGKRTEQRSLIRRIIYPIAIILVWVVIIFGFVWVVPLIGWTEITVLLRTNIGSAATLFNFLMIFSFIGSIMVSSTTVANSARMEYLMTMPIS